MYVWQMIDGRWHVSAYTSTVFCAKAHRNFMNGYDTRAAADQALAEWKAAGNEIKRRW